MAVHAFRKLVAFSGWNRPCTSAHAMKACGGGQEMLRAFLTTTPGVPFQVRSVTNHNWFGHKHSAGRNVGPRQCCADCRHGQVTWARSTVTTYTWQHHQFRLQVCPLSCSEMESGAQVRDSVPIFTENTKNSIPLSGVQVNRTWRHGPYAESGTNHRHQTKISFCVNVKTMFLNSLSDLD